MDFFFFADFSFFFLFFFFRFLFFSIPEKWVGLGFTQGASHDLAQYFQGKKTQGIFLLLPALHPHSILLFIYLLIF